MQKKESLNTLFDIQSDEAQIKDMTLLIEAGPDHCTYAFLSADHKSLSQLKFVSHDETDAEISMKKIIEEVRLNEIKNTTFCSAYPQSLLMPQKGFKEDYSLLNLIYDQPDQHFRHDRIAEWQMINIYSLPNSLNALLEQLPNPKFCHVYTTSLRIYNGFVAEDQICVHFTTQYFRIIVKRAQHVQLAQTYFYKTPLDVVYYLLKICAAFGLDQKNACLILSGLVEEDSSMYKEIHNYFLNIQFAHPPVLALPKNEHPHHFFTSLYNLAACES